MFQSTPVNYDGRNVAENAWPPDAMSFQSTPVNYDGRNVGHVSGGRPHQQVSIHSRQLRREKPMAVATAAAITSGFNPLPSITTGETRQCELFDDVEEFQSTPVNYDGRNEPPPSRQSAPQSVSIHSRQLRREKRLGRCSCCTSKAVSIHSRQLRREKRNGSHHRQHASARFNPLPSITTGETLAAGRLRGMPSCFNPLPSITTGETAAWRNLRPRPRSFNPLPSITTGETQRLVEPFQLADQVSIHSRQLRREKLFKPNHMIFQTKKLAFREPAAESASLTLALHLSTSRIQ